MARLHDPNDWASSFSELGFSQFFKNRAVKRRRFGQPVLMREEGKKQNIYGFGAELYCPYCDEIFDFILLEFENSGAPSSPGWGEINLEEFEEDLMKCPKCGNRELGFEIT